MRLLDNMEEEEEKKKMMMKKKQLKFFFYFLLSHSLIFSSLSLSLSHLYLIDNLNYIFINILFIK